MNVQEEIKKLRTERGISREKLAQKCGLTAQTIYRAEKTGKITLSNYFKITNTLKNDTITNPASL
jgi:DNA-binding XRE family transcriptional regulator